MFNQQPHEALGVEYEFIPAGVLVPAKQTEVKVILFHARIPSQKTSLSKASLSPLTFDSSEFAHETRLFLKEL